MDAGNILKPMLARGELHCIGATTLDEYRQYIEKDPALERRFQPVMVQEPTVEDTISILRGLKERYEVYHGVKIQDGALIAAATLSNRYITDRFLPDKAIDLVDEACAMVKTELDSMPAELDDLNHKITQLQIEQASLQKETDEMSKQRLAAMQNALSEALAQAAVPGQPAVLHCDGADGDGLRRICLAVSARTNALTAVLASGGQGLAYALCLPGGDVRPVCKALNEAFGGRGGGKPGFCQGSLACTDFADVQNFLVNYHE